jgi:hypothetical protein
MRGQKKKARPKPRLKERSCGVTLRRPVLTVKPERRAKPHEGEYQGRDRKPHARHIMLC